MNKLLKYIFAIILYLSLTIVVLINILNSTILSKEYILNKLEESNYYNNIYTEVENNFENYIYQSGLDPIVLENIVSRDKIKEDTNIIISNIYDGSNKNIDLEVVRNNLSTNIDKSLEDRCLSEENKKAINKFIDIIINEYEDTIMNTDYSSKINTGISSINNKINMINIIMIILVIISILSLILLNIKKKRRKLSIFGIPLLALGLLIITIYLYIILNIDINNIVILNDAISIAVHYILNGIVVKFLINGSIFTILGILIIVIGNMLRYKKVKKMS